MNKCIQIGEAAVTERESKLVRFLIKKGGLATYAEILNAGFNKTAIRNGIDSNSIARIDRGLYKLTEGMTLAFPDIVASSIRVTKGVVCLVSALYFYGATDEIPRHVDMAIPRGTRTVKINYPPVKFYRFDIKTWEAGIEHKKIDGRIVKIYNLAKTVADCFKFRKKIGVDIAGKALKSALMEKHIRPDEIMHYAMICSVGSIVKPAIENIIL